MLFLETPATITVDTYPYTPFDDDKALLFGTPGLTLLLNKQ